MALRPRRDTAIAITTSAVNINRSAHGAKNARGAIKSIAAFMKGFTMSELPRLRDCPAWTYLLRDIYDAYRSVSAGGSTKIRAHQRIVREAISAIGKANVEVTDAPGTDKPATAHLQRALDLGRAEKFGALIRGIDIVRPHLDWKYGYEKMPRGLAKKFAYAEFAGPSGPVVTERIILGLVLFAPGSTYPAHAHDGITESYICLSGAVSENDQGVYAPGSLIFNPPGQMHRITVADHQPSLLLWAWVGPTDKLASQKMVFSRRRD